MKKSLFFIFLGALGFSACSSDSENSALYCEQDHTATLSFRNRVGTSWALSIDGVRVGTIEGDTIMSFTVPAGIRTARASDLTYSRAIVKELTVEPCGTYVVIVPEY